jgi:hypothetical protein
MIEIVHAHILPAALGLLPAEMDTPPARAMLLAIGLQESKFLNRRQVGGPARGFWQFERGGGVTGVLNHAATRDAADAALRALRYAPSDRLTEVVYEAIEHNDVLACVCARLLLWTVPARLSRRDESAMGWTAYLAGWRPGRPNPQTWAAHYTTAWEMVAPTSV